MNGVSLRRLVSLIALSLLTILLASAPVAAQTALFIELGGAAFLSANVEHRLDQGLSLRAGISPFGREEIYLPLGISYLSSRKAWTGDFGLTVVPVVGEDARVAVSGIVGVRYHPAGPGIFARAAWTPMIVPFEENRHGPGFIGLMWVGLAAGYAFR